MPFAVLLVLLQPCAAQSRLFCFIEVYNREKAHCISEFWLHSVYAHKFHSWFPNLFRWATTVFNIVKHKLGSMRGICNINRNRRDKAMIWLESGVFQLWSCTGEISGYSLIRREDLQTWCIEHIVCHIHKIQAAVQFQYKFRVSSFLHVPQVPQRSSMKKTCLVSQNPPILKSPAKSKYEHFFSTEMQTMTFLIIVIKIDIQTQNKSPKVRTRIPPSPPVVYQFYSSISVDTPIW